MGSPSDETLILPIDSPGASLERVGGKGASLARLAQAGLAVPTGFHITTRAYRRFVGENQLSERIVSAAAESKADDPSTLAQASAHIQALIAQGQVPHEMAASIRQAYGALGGGEESVAVRSSATAEDLPELSFAGQQETYLNVRGGERVVDTVKRCWASLWTARAIGYRARQEIPPADVALAVVVQQLVPADVAGVLFTANPVTGARDEIVINAAWGLGEAIVGSVVTPDTITVDKATGAIRSQEIADKAVMTMRTSDGTREEPVPNEKRGKAALTAEQAAEVAKLGAQIEQHFERPMDVEWALAGGRFFILQARPITALPEPKPTLDWTTPNPRGQYGRASVVELLPEPLSPLFATLALPAWNQAYRGLMKQLGVKRGMPEPFLLTINDYAYYDYSDLSWKLLLALPRLIGRGFDWTRRAQTRWADEARPCYAALIGPWEARDLRAMSATELFAGAKAIVQETAEHYLTIQSGILPTAASSEGLFDFVYRKLIRRKDEPPSVTFMLGFDSAPIQAEKSLYDLALWARGQAELAGYLTRASNAEIAAATRANSASEPIADLASWAEFRVRFGEHLRRFGHAVYDLDFAKAIAAEEPAPLIETLKFYLTGERESPYDRQAAAVAAREQAQKMLQGRLRGLRAWMFRKLLAWAQRYAPLREDALADVGLGWPLVRRIFRELGRRLVAARALADENDVCWLKRDELEASARALDSGQSPHDSRSTIEERRRIWEREHHVTPPVVLPVKGGIRFFGFDFTKWMPARSDQAGGDTIIGTGASPGRVTGAACVIRGTHEFHQMQQRGILVAKITTPAWTPLFALASGVVTDVGGLLSHGSIVAREYHIPAVLGTGVATERIQNGQRITVDGDRGVVTLAR